LKLASVREGDDRRAFLVAGGRAGLVTSLDPDLPGELTALVADWPRWRERLSALRVPADAMPMDGVQLSLPLRPRRILATGGNYRDHLAEMRATGPAHPSGFLKLPETAQGPEEPLVLRPQDQRIDYEGEIALVIGAPARGLEIREAASAIAGLMLANDISARDVPTAHIVLAKGRDGFCPLGPMLVTLDEVSLDEITFEVRVNGELRQRASTNAMVHSFAEIVSSYSRSLALEPGDVILTGTPAGVGVGREPPVFLAPGDEVVVSSPGLGTLRTPVIAQPQPYTGRGARWDARTQTAAM
jgi:2-keto-4-pentenoate hydratase/2-oxohepta-3-ene-1,7-dioic acid hydratase in catechol pathway